VAVGRAQVGVPAGTQPAAHPAAAEAAAAAAPAMAAAAADSKNGAGGGKARDAWLRQHFPRAKPPRREDADSLRLWLEQELGSLERQERLREQQDEEGKEEGLDCGGGPDAAAADGVAPRAPLPAAASCYEAPPPQAEASQLLYPQVMLADGSLDVRTLRQRQAVVAAAFWELCRQVGALWDGYGALWDARGGAHADACIVCGGRCWGSSGVPACCQAPSQASRLCVCFDQRWQRAALVLAPVMQVSVGCVERGRLMSQCWATLGDALRAALADRARAGAGAAAASRAAAAARAEVEDVRRRARDEVTALRVLMERHAAHVEQARRETTGWVQKTAQVRWGG
jgi:hypothetical protein